MAAPSPGAAKKAVKAAPAEAPGGFGMTGFKSDPNAPINIDSETLTVDDIAHKAIFRRGIAILEGLDLAEAPAGSGRIYELISPPLRLMGCDASPVRALLREMP